MLVFVAPFAMPFSLVTCAVVMRPAAEVVALPMAVLTASMDAVTVDTILSLTALIAVYTPPPLTGLDEFSVTVVSVTMPLEVIFCESSLSADTRSVFSSVVRLASVPTFSRPLFALVSTQLIAATRLSLSVVSS